MSFAAILASPNWFDPRTWPLAIDLWLGFIALSALWSFVQNQRKARTLSWPTSEGHIEHTSTGRFIGFSLTRPAKRGQYDARISYSYFVHGTRYAGEYSRQFHTHQEADEYVRDLEGKPIIVSWNPSAPQRSTLQENAIELLQAARPPHQEQDPEYGPLGIEAVLLRVLAFCSAVGFLVSLAVNIAGWLGKAILPTPMFIAMHVGIFPLWFIMIIVIRRQGRSSRNWKSMLRGAPEWSVNLIYVLFAYTFLNFGLFALKAPTDHQSHPLDAMQWRGFSGHWMLFYYVAATALYAASTHGPCEDANRIA